MLKVYFSSILYMHTYMYLRVYTYLRIISEVLYIPKSREAGWHLQVC